MRRIVVLGGGLVGSIVAWDLAQDSELKVEVVDLDESTLSRVQQRCGDRVLTSRADLSDPSTVSQLVKPADLVIGALPGWLGYRTLETVIRSRKSFVDISFMPEDAATLNGQAAEAGVVGVVDMGVAPGMSNVLAARCVTDLDIPEQLRIYVGGLPLVRRQPYQYAIVFSPSDVLEEYTRPARLVRDGKLVIRPALSDLEEFDFDRVGTVEAFNSDGLRSLVDSLRVPDMCEKTLRFPGHARCIQLLKDSGFLSSEPILVQNTRVRPVELACKLLSRCWQLPEGEGDMTIMRVSVSGLSGTNRLRHVYDLRDVWDSSTATTSMARTTGFPCAIVARMVLDGSLGLPVGVHFPENIAGIPTAMSRLVEELAVRGVQFDHRIEQLGGQTDSRG